MNPKYFLLVIFFATTKACGDFYWRDYDGKIPWDAVPGGKNADGVTYIGQAYIHTYGLMLGTIFPGKTEITVPCYGVKKTDVIIKEMTGLQAVRTLIEKCSEYKVPLHLVFIDYQKAFDFVGDLDSSASDGCCEDRFKIYTIKRGVRLSDTILPKLFTLDLQDVSHIMKRTWFEKRASSRVFSGLVLVETTSA